MSDLPLSPNDLEIIDGTPRVAASSLAKALGFARPRNIRDLIDRNIEELRSYGHMPHVRRMIEIGKGAKREVVDHLLNEHQALVIASLSSAPNAPAVRRALIECFVAFRKGQQPRPQAQMRGPAAPTRCEWRGKELIRRHKLDLARAVMALDDLGVDVLAIDMNAVVQFSRFLSGREPAPVTATTGA